MSAIGETHKNSCGEPADQRQYIAFSIYRCL